MSSRDVDPSPDARSRRATAVLACLLTLGFVFVAACAQDTRYRVLTFLFDGVPEPGAEAVETEASGAPENLNMRQFNRATVERRFVHTAMRKRQCQACHRLASAMGAIKAEEGLCRQCHRTPPGDLKFVHGPVAVDACLECHHHHESPHPGFALEGPKTLCYRCHDREDLTTGEHHAAVGSEEGVACTQCHDPHGGNDRFFLKRRDQR